MKALLLWIFNTPNRLICRIFEHKWVYSAFQGKATTRECRRCLTEHTPKDDEGFQEMVDDTEKADAIRAGYVPPDWEPDEDDPVIRLCRALKEQREFYYLEEQYKLAVGTFDIEKGCTDVPDITPWQLQERMAKFHNHKNKELREWAEMRVGQVDEMVAFAEKHLKATDLARFKDLN